MSIVATCARLASSFGLIFPSPVPLMIPASTAQRKALTAQSEISRVRGRAALLETLFYDTPAGRSMIEFANTADT